VTNSQKPSNPIYAKLQ